MKLVEVKVEHLRPGMFVAELDRPWLDTPFALQGFMVRDEEDIDYIAKYVNTVFVDIEYHGRFNFLPKNSYAPTLRHSRLTQNVVDTAATRKPQLKRILKSDFSQAQIDYTSATESLNKVFDSIRNGSKIKVSSVREAVSPLIRSVLSRKEAVAALARIKKSDDGYRYNHGISMAVWSAVLGRHMALPNDELEQLVVSCAICDIGMTLMPSEMINGTGPLSDDQREELLVHPHLSRELLEEDDVNIEILSVIENHHERYDGSGYPRGLSGAQIPLLARIAGIVDSYDAMITPRPYAPARSSYEATQELLDCADELYQKELVEQFVQSIGMFPTGSLVELNSGEVAIVVRQNDARRLRPEVVVILTPEKEHKEKLEIVDLMQYQYDDKYIAKELPPGSFGVVNSDYFI